jgi:hypothetical protein
LAAFHRVYRNALAAFHRVYRNALAAFLIAGEKSNGR